MVTPAASFTVQMSCENDAFSHPNGTEIARILRVLADKLDGEDVDGGDTYRLLDANGNTTGEAFAA